MAVADTATAKNFIELEDVGVQLYYGVSVCRQGQVARPCTKPDVKIRLKILDLRGKLGLEEVAFYLLYISHKKIIIKLFLP